MSSLSSLPKSHMSIFTVSMLVNGTPLVLVIWFHGPYDKAMASASFAPLETPIAS